MRKTWLKWIVAAYAGYAHHFDGYDVPALCFCAQERAAFPGPLWRGGRVEESPQDGPHGCGPVFRRYMDVPSENPVTRPRTRSPWMGGGRAIGVPFLFGYFLFGHAKRK